VTFYNIEVFVKTTDIQLQLPQLKAHFAGRLTIRKNDLRAFYRRRAENFSEQSFRRILYALQKEEVLVPLGAGILGFKQPEKRRFSYSPSKKLSSLHAVLQKAFPYLDFLCWETSLLHQFMIHQPRENQLVVEAEKDACASVFHRLAEKYKTRVFLDPTRSIMEEYVLPQAHPIIVLPLISQSPRTTINGIPVPKLEKILVDIFVDENIYFAFQGNELSNIYETAFAIYWLNERTMFRYATRRKATRQLRQFLEKKTRIQLAV
jgi:hypothetical protein